MTDTDNKNNNGNSKNTPNSNLNNVLKNSSDEKMNTVSKSKKKGLIRVEAIIPFCIVVLVTISYFHFLFDYHLRKGFEFAGYQIIGAEVNIKNLETSFLNGTFRLQGLEVTDASNPSKNMIYIDDIRFGVLWDGLLRARIVVEEMAVEQIQISTPRTHPGKVKPPEPIKEKSNEPSALEKEANKLKDKTVNTVEKKYNNNILGDVASLIGNSSSKVEAGSISDKLASKQKLDELDSLYKEKKRNWDEKLKTLPKSEEIENISKELGKVKTKDFKSPQEIQQSLEIVSKILKEADQKYKSVQAAGSDLSNDLKTLDTGFKELDTLIKSDIKELESRFKIPKLDAKSLSEGIFYSYLAPYLQKFNKYKGLVEKYAPPKLLKKKGSENEQAEENIQPHPREKGVTYEFFKSKSYPLFWIKKIIISSKDNSSKVAEQGASSGSSKSSSPNSDASAMGATGNIQGLATNLTSNQSLVGSPTIIDIKGDFPQNEIFGFETKIVIDTLHKESVATYLFKLGSFPISEKELIQSPDINIKFTKATSSLSSEGKLIDLSKYSFKLNNGIKSITYDISAKNKDIEGIIKPIFEGLPVITVDANADGTLDSGLNMNINSNLGSELQSGLERQLQKKIDELRSQLQAQFDEAVGNKKKDLESQISKSKSEIESQVKKIEGQLNAEKSKGDAKINEAKKDGENQTKKKLESEAKKLLGEDGDKKLDDLKKRFGF